MQLQEKTAPQAFDTDSSAEPPKLKLILPFGRGCSGKSLWARWLIDRSRSRNQPLLAGDADLINPSLEPYFDGTVTPRGDHEAALTDWFASIYDHQLADQRSAIADLGPYTRLLGKAIKQLAAISSLETCLVEPVAVHLIGPDPGDLAYLRHYRELLAPEKTILVLNERTRASQLATATAFQPIIEHPLFTAALARGAKVVSMPHLPFAYELEAPRLTFSAVDAGHSTNGLPRIGIGQRLFVARWLRDMEHNFAPVASWLA